jgi:hypothetical protein
LVEATVGAPRDLRGRQRFSQRPFTPRKAVRFQAGKIYKDGKKQGDQPDFVKKAPKMKPDSFFLPCDYFFCDQR